MQRELASADALEHAAPIQACARSLSHTDLPDVNPPTAQACRLAQLAVLKVCCRRTDSTAIAVNPWAMAAECGRPVFKANWSCAASSAHRHSFRAADLASVSCRRVKSRKAFLLISSVTVAMAGAG